MITTYLSIIFWISGLLVIYSYAIYPIILLLLFNQWKKRPAEIPESTPGISIVVAAYNEEKVIENKILNCLSLEYPKDLVEIIIVSDGSTDGTNNIVERYIPQGIQLIKFDERRGKVNVLNGVIPKAKNEIVVLSDANTIFAPGAIKKLVRHFINPEIGCVCGALQFITEDGNQTAELEGVYWRYETFLKRIEGIRGSLLGANGAIYAIRKNLFVQLPSDTIVEDFVLPMKILQNGYKVIYEPQAFATETAGKRIVQEKERRIRIGAGDFQALIMLLPMLNPNKGFTAFAFWSHKVLRWFAPFFLITTFFSNLFLLDIPLHMVIFVIQLAFYACALAGQILSMAGSQRKIFSICYYFVSMNLALLLGFFRFVGGRQKVTWQRTER